jgi:hypothetical protein
VRQIPSSNYNGTHSFRPTPPHHFDHGGTTPVMRA